MLVCLKTPEPIHHTNNTQHSPQLLVQWQRKVDIIMKISHDALTFDDLLLIPRYSEVLPNEVDLTTQLTRHISLKMPLLSAAMDTVTEAKLAITLAQEGGIGILHKNMSTQAQAEQVRQVKKFESGVIQDPVTISPETTVGKLKELTQSHGFSGMPVMDSTSGKNQVVGIVTNRDIRFEKDMSKKVADVMTSKDQLVTVAEGTDKHTIMTLMQEHRIEKILVVDQQFSLRGMVTVKDILKAKEKPNASKDEQGQLRVGAAVGVGAETEERIEHLIVAGVDVIIIDTAHGHSKKVLERIQATRKAYPNLAIIGGNIATADAAQALIDAGVDGLKVGMGPGSICTTRIIAGIGVPQASAVDQVARIANQYNIPIIADGGIRFSGDIGKAIAAGASSVMIGSLLAGTEESPGEVIYYQGRAYKSYRGMGSVGAMSGDHSSADRYFQEKPNHMNHQQKLVPEGIEGRVPYKGSAVTVLHQLMGGLRSTMGYTGAKDINTLRTQVEFVRISSASMKESHVHDVMITKEAPNYSI